MHRLATMHSIGQTDRRKRPRNIQITANKNKHNHTLPNRVHFHLLMKKM